METLKQVLAFPMYLTAIWLLWVLGKQRGVDALALMLVGATLLALGLFCFERSRWKSHRLGMGLAAVMLVLAIVPVVGVTRLRLPAATAAEGVVAFSPQLLDRLRADNRVVFVNMTADWCVTCKANEKNVLSSADFRDALRRRRRGLHERRLDQCRPQDQRLPRPAPGRRRAAVRGLRPRRTTGGAADRADQRDHRGCVAARG